MTKAIYLVSGLDDTEKLVKGIGGECYSYVVNLADKDDIYRVAEKVYKEIGRVSYFYVSVLRYQASSSTFFQETKGEIDISETKYLLKKFSVLIMH